MAQRARRTAHRARRPAFPRPAGVGGPRTVFGEASGSPRPRRAGRQPRPGGPDAAARGAPGHRRRTRHHGLPVVAHHQRARARLRRSHHPVVFECTSLWFDRVSVSRAPRSGRPSTRGTTIGRRDRLCPQRRADNRRSWSAATRWRSVRPGRFSNPTSTRSSSPTSMGGPTTPRTRTKTRRCLVIWLVVRRYRVLMAITVAALVGLAVWMILLGHVSDATESSFACTHGTFACSTRSGSVLAFRSGDRDQFPAAPRPLPARGRFWCPPGRRRTRTLHQPAGLDPGGLQDQVVDREVGGRRVLSRRASCCAGVCLSMVDRAGDATSHNLNLWLGEFGRGRLQPLYFPITGLALSAYTLFAFVLSAALAQWSGRPPGPFFGTVVLYTALSVLAVFVIRPSLAPQVFEPFATTSAGYVQLSSGSASTMKPGIWASASATSPARRRPRWVRPPTPSANCARIARPRRHAWPSIICSRGPSTNRQITTGSCSGVSPSFSSSQQELCSGPPSCLSVDGAPSTTPPSDAPHSGASPSISRHAVVDPIDRPRRFQGG